MPSPNDVPTLYFLHALGASAGSFRRLGDALAGRVDVQGIDLPGFGSETAASDTSLEATVAHVVGILNEKARGRWILGGHSMGGKIAGLVASRVLGGTAPLTGLAGMVLLAPSPPRPEPMDEERRALMLSWVEDGAISEPDAETFIDQNTARPLDPARRASRSPTSAARPRRRGARGSRTAAASTRAPRWARSTSPCWSSRATTTPTSAPPLSPGSLPTSTRAPASTRSPTPGT